MATILILEDDLTLSETLRDALSGDGHDVHAFHDVCATQAFLSNGGQADLAFVDLVIEHGGQMVPENGLALIRSLDGKTQPAIPCIAISSGFSSVHGAHERKVAKLLGAKDTLAKPFRFESLQRKIGDLLAADESNDKQSPSLLSKP